MKHTASAVFKKTVPDIRVVYKDKRCESNLFEVKPDYKAAGEEFASEVRARAKACREQGLGKYSVLLESEIRKEPRMSNVRMLFCARQYKPVDLKTEKMIQRFVRKRGVVTINDVIHHFYDQYVSSEMILWLLVNWKLQFDQTQPLCGETEIVVKSRDKRFCWSLD